MAEIVKRLIVEDEETGETWEYRRFNGNPGIYHPVLITEKNEGIFTEGRIYTVLNNDFGWIEVLDDVGDTVETCNYIPVKRLINRKEGER